MGPRFVPAIMAGAMAGICGCNMPTACDCGPTGATVAISEDRASDLAGVSVAGPCTLDWDEVGSSGPAVHVESAATGTCHLEMTFKSGAPAYEVDLAFRFIDGDCCQGVYAVGPRSLAVPTATLPDGGCDEAGVDHDAGIGAIDAGDPTRGHAGSASQR